MKGHISAVHNVLSAYRNFWIPPSLTNLVAWYDIVADRPAVRVVTSDRTLESQNTYPHERIHRNQYLVEVYEPYARYEERMFKELNEQRSGPGVQSFIPFDLKFDAKCVEVIYKYKEMFHHFLVFSTDDQPGLRFGEL